MDVVGTTLAVTGLAVATVGLVTLAPEAGAGDIAATIIGFDVAAAGTAFTAECDFLDED